MNYRTRLCHQFVYVRNGRALVSGAQTLAVPWPDGMRSAWVVYRCHDGEALAITENREVAETHRSVLEAVA